MENPREIRTERHDDVMVLYLTESVAIFNPDEAEAAVKEATRALELEGIKALVVDLSAIEKCGTQLMTVLVRIHIRAKKRGKDLRLCEISQFVQDSIRICGLAPLFETYAYQDEAIAGPSR